MEILLLIGKAIFMAIITSVLASNLIGFFVRFVFYGKSMNKTRDRIADNSVLLDSVNEHAPRSRIIFFQVMSGLGLLCGLFVYWKYLSFIMLLALLVAMIARLPDLIDNIKGKPIIRRSLFRSTLSWIPVILVFWNYFKDRI